MKINNRRYIGSKTSLLNNINEVVEEYFGNKKVKFADVFGGTGVVAYHFAEKGYPVVVNDFLYSNYIAYKTWMSSEKINLNKMTKLLNEFSNIATDKINDNYFSKYFSDKYFEYNDAKKIGYIREEIEKLKDSLTEREYCFLITSLMYETDRIANTCGHFESFLNKKPIEKGIDLRVPELKEMNEKNEIYCMDTNELVKSIDADVFYIDPPYNARQYVNFYHVLENLARWEKPTEFEGNSMKFKRNHLKSDYSKSKAPDVFKNLINDINGKLIIVSYNNTYNAKSGASNNKISEEQMVEILNSKGNVRKIEIDYKFFNAGKTDFDNHKEYLYVCEVNKNGN